MKYSSYCGVIYLSRLLIMLFLISRKLIFLVEVPLIITSHIIKTSYFVILDSKLFKIFLPPFLKAHGSWFKSNISSMKSKQIFDFSCGSRHLLKGETVSSNIILHPNGSIWKLLCWEFSLDLTTLLSELTGCNVYFLNNCWGMGIDRGYINTPLLSIH